MTPQQFVATYLVTALEVKAGTGLDETTLLAQWADETAWSTSWAGAPFNLGNIRCSPTTFCRYSSLDEFAGACVATFHNGFYQNVLATAGQSIESQIAALGASPWSAGHYNSGGGPGSALIPFAEAICMFNDTDRAVLNQVHQGLFGQDPAVLSPSIQDFLRNPLLTSIQKSATVDLTPVLNAIAALKTELDAVKAEVDTLAPEVAAIKAKTDRDLA